METTKKYGRLELMEEIQEGLTANGRSIMMEHSLYVRALGGVVVKISPFASNENSWIGVVIEVFTFSGRLDSTYLSFDQNLTISLSQALDEESASSMFIWKSLSKNKEEDWYIARPESMAPLIRKLNDFISFLKT